MESEFVLIQGKPNNQLSVTNFSSLGQLYESLVRKYFRELEKGYEERAAKQIITETTNRAIASS